MPKEILYMSPLPRGLEEMSDISLLARVHKPRLVQGLEWENACLPSMRP
jgi:hypothetical protein